MTDLSATGLRGHHPRCMGCGAENPDSLGLQVRIDGDHVHATVTFDERHTGGPGYVHGGAIAAAMDDVLGHVLVALHRPAVTAQLTVDYVSPPLLGREFTFSAWCERIEGRRLHLRGEARDGDAVIARAQAVFVEVDVSHWSGSGAPLPAHWKQ